MGVHHACRASKPHDILKAGRKIRASQQASGLFEVTGAGSFAEAFQVGRGVSICPRLERCRLTQRTWRSKVEYSKIAS